MKDEDKIIAKLTAQVERLTKKKGPQLQEGKIFLKEKPFYKSKKFIAALAGVLTTLANKYLDLGLSQAELVTLISPILAYVLGQGFADLGKNKKG